MTAMLRTEALAKSFVLHLQGGVRLPVLAGVSFAVAAGECLALTGPSGAGKSTLLRCLFGTNRADSGRVVLRHDGGEIDLAAATPRQILGVRARSLGYVSQFLRVVPRVSALDIVAEAVAGHDRAAADALLAELDLPARLRRLPPATFSGGEQQRVNLARGFAGGHPILLLDEPTASLDPARAEIVVAMITRAKARGTAIIGIFHDASIRDRVADRLYDMRPVASTP